MFTSAHDNIEFLYIDATLGKSDHATINFGYRCTPEPSPDKITYKYYKADYVKVKEMLELDWPNILDNNHDDVNVQRVTFIEKYEEAEKLCVPKKIVETRQKRFSIPLDRKTLAKKRKKYRLWKRYMETEDGKIFTEYRQCSNQLRRLSSKATKLYEQNTSKQAKGNPKAFWRYVGSKTNMKNKIPDLYSTDDNNPDLMTKDDRGKADRLGDFFSSVFKSQTGGGIYLTSLKLNIN